MNFFNIGKANAEIERLQESLKQSQEEIATLKENAAVLEKAAECEKARADKADEALKAAGDGDKGRIAALEKDNGDLRARAEKAEKEKEEYCKDFDGKVEKAAAQKALSITAGQGQPPVTPPANGEKPAPAAKELKGFERVVAAFKNQTAQKALTK